MSKRRKRHSPEQIVRKLRDADAMLNAGKDLAAVLQALEVSEATWNRWRNQYGGMKSEEAKRLSALEDENRRLKQLVADLSLDNQMLKHVASKNCRAEIARERSRALRRSVRPPWTCNSSSRFPSEGRARCWSSRAARSDIGEVPGVMTGRCAVDCGSWYVVGRGSGIAA